MTSDLDAIDRASADPSGMLATVESSGRLWRHALELARGAPEHAARDPRAVAILGMGGSGIAGDIAAVFADASGAAPVVAVKGYRLPSWIGPDDLVLAVSYSGNTEETLAAVDAADRSGAVVAAVTSGGQLGDRAEARGWPVTSVPGGAQPRAVLPYVAVPVLVSLVRAGVLPTDLLDDLERVGDHVDAGASRWGGGRATRDNTAKQAALAIHPHVPVFHGGRGLGALVAQRARCQVNENAAWPAWSSELPELDHNEVVGWDAPADVTEGFALVRLRTTPEEHPQVGRRFDATHAVVGDAFAAVVDHAIDGEVPATRLAGAILWVDLVSVYLALLAGVDPTAIDPIDRLKAMIARP